MAWGAARRDRGWACLQLSVLLRVGLLCFHPLLPLHRLRVPGRRGTLFCLGPGSAYLLWDGDTRITKGTEEHRYFLRHRHWSLESPKRRVPSDTQLLSNRKRQIDVLNMGEGGVCIWEAYDGVIRCRAFLPVAINPLELLFLPPCQAMLLVLQ